jgi:hypothetical protein
MGGDSSLTTKFLPEGIKRPPNPFEVVFSTGSSARNLQGKAKPPFQDYLEGSIVERFVDTIDLLFLPIPSLSGRAIR